MDGDGAEQCSEDEETRPCWAGEQLLKRRASSPRALLKPNHFPPLLILEREARKSVACLNRPRGGSRPADWPEQRSRGSSWGDAGR